MWWSNSEQRRIQKERVKNKIKQTKLNEKNGTLPGMMPFPTAPFLSSGPRLWVNHRLLLDARARAASLGSSPFSSMDYDFNRTFIPESYDPFASHLPTPILGQSTYPPYGPYEVDIKTERQTFINDVPTRRDSSISTFNTFAPPYLHATLPTFPGEEWLQEECFNPPPPYGGFDPAAFDFVPEQSYSTMQSTIPVDDRDRPLLNHFVDNVLRLAFPILDIHQQGPARTRAILQSLETNKCYLHCCLSVAAIHLKTTEGLTGDVADHDIMRHRYEAVSQLCQALNQDTNHDQILEATLAMIFFHCSVGSPDDYLPDIPWSDHFQAASNLVTKLDLPTLMAECHSSYVPPPFNMTLTAWIDILGSTMLGKTPQFAHLYRTKHLSGTPSGLRELMGCDDRVMYLISEIACLDALKAEGHIDDMGVCSHVHALGTQLDFTEPQDRALEHPYSPVNGAIRPEQLTKNMTAIFRAAARIYLCSLVPGFDRTQQSNINLVSAVTHMLQYIPAGPEGFDRSLVWPFMITGVFSTPDSEFRSLFAERVAALGEHADFGSFGRMYRLLQEVWRLTDDPMTPKTETSFSPSGSPAPKQETADSPPAAGTPGMREIKRQHLHWRDIMRRNGWHYLLI